MSDRFKGLVVPMLTPFDSTGAADSEKALRLAKDLLSSGANGLALFGTTSEGQSLGVAERMDILDALIGGGVPASKLMVGTGSCSLTEAIQMTRGVVERKCGGVLMLPPYFYKIVSDEGIYQFFAKVIGEVASPNLRIYLYHIPPVAQVGFSIELIGRLINDFPEQVVGLKNSSGDHNYSIALRENYPQFDVFCGSEDFLLETMRIGGVGCISATGNINPQGINNLYEKVDTAEAEELQKSISKIRAAVQRRPMIPALKAIISRTYQDSEWVRIRPPLVSMADDAVEGLIAELEEIDFSVDKLFV